MILFGHQMSRASAPTRRRHRLLALLLLLFPLVLLGCHGGTIPGATRNKLNAVVALSSNDVWAVGGMSTPKHANFHFQVLIEHWDGAAWHAAMPDLPGELCAISAISANDIWAVGGSWNCTDGGQLLTLHWDGRHWQQFSALMDDSSGALTAIAALSPLDVWAVGHTRRQALIEHWDGAQWQVGPQPFSGLSFTLQAIAARAADDIWTVGFAADSQGNRFSLTEHWDGHSWQVVPMPGYAQDKRLNGYPDFGGLAAFSHGQLWAVGEIDLSSVYQETPLIERWDGAAWQVVYGSAPSQPNPSKPGASLQAVAAVTAQDAWAVGNASTHDAGKYEYVLILHWDGHDWLPVNAPSFGLVSQLVALAVFSASDIWAVGSTTLDYSGNSRTLIEHWNGSLWQTVPSPNPGMPGPSIGSG